MTRSQVKFARILRENRRLATLKKRKEDLFKRLEAVCILCKVEACMMVCDGPSDPGTNDSMVWPSRQEAASMISRFMSIPVFQRSYKVTTHEKFIENLLVTEKKKLEGVKRKNHEMEMEDMLHDLLVDPPSVATEFHRLNQLFFYIEDLIEKISEKERLSHSVDNASVA